MCNLQGASKDARTNEGKGVGAINRTLGGRKDREKGKTTTNFQERQKDM